VAAAGRAARRRAPRRRGRGVPPTPRPSARAAKNHVYDEVVDLLRTLQPLNIRAGRDGDFAELVTEIREGYKRRPNLIKRLDCEGL
jgi:uncharacterized Zn finger protein